MNATKLTSALKSNLDATRLLAQTLYDSDPPILDYDTAMSIPVRCPAISKAIRDSWDDRSDEIDQALAAVEESEPDFVERVWTALLA